MGWKYFFILLLMGFSVTLNAQVEDYYRLRKRRSQPYLFNHPDLVRTRSHWYMGVEGGGKWNGGLLSNDLNGFLNIRHNIIDSYAGGHLGYSHNLRWSLEMGYIHNPSNLAFWVNASRPEQFLVNDLQHTIPLRLKWRVLRIGKIQKLSGIYLGTGFLWTPSRRRQQITGFQLVGLSRASRNRIDTILVENQSFTTGRAQLEWEGSVEFVGRVAQHIEIVGFGRIGYAGASALSSHSEYFINRTSQNTSMATLLPRTYYFGLSVRYLYKLKNVYWSRFEE